MNFPSQFELKFSRTDRKFGYDTKDSMFGLKYSTTERPQKYILKEFKDKHFPEDKFKEISRKNEHKGRMSFIQNPFQKQERKNAIAYSG